MTIDIGTETKYVSVSQHLLLQKRFGGIDTISMRLSNQKFSIIIRRGFKYGIFSGIHAMQNLRRIDFHKKYIQNFGYFKK